MGLNCIYANNQNGTFTKITLGTIVTESLNSFGVSIADYNNDGLLDIYVTEWHSANSLYKNLGNFVFEKITTGNIVSEYSDTEGSTWGDYNNDGFKDLFTTNDGVNFLYKNNGDETFTKIDDLNICTEGDNSNGCSFTDYNNDGFVDLFIANGGNQTNLLYYNTKNENNWLKIKCIGVEHNNSAIGVRVAVLATINNQQMWQYQEVSAQSGGGYGSQNGLVLNFGLGNATKVDSVIVKWNNRINENFSKIPVNSKLTIIQNIDNSVKENNSNLSFVDVYPNPFTEQINFNYSLQNKSVVDMKIFATDGKLVDHCIDNKTEMQGDYTVSLSKNIFNDEGVFVYVFKINNISYSGKIVLKN